MAFCSGSVENGEGICWRKIPSRSYAVGSSGGSTAPPARCTTGGNTTAKGTSTTGGFPALLAGGLGKAGHHRFPSKESPGGVPPPEVPDEEKTRNGI